MKESSMRLCTFFAAVAALLLAERPADAQGLLWNLPADGAWVRYEGTYRQLVRRPQSTEGDLTLQWQRNLEIKSVGQEEATHDLDHDGVEVTEMCRWLEFKIVTANFVEGVPDPGPGATRIYKVLVPESYIDGQIVDDENIFRAFIPVVKGFRKLGDEPAQPLESNVLQIYPNLSLMRHYRDLQTDGTEQSADVPNAGAVTVNVIKGSLQMETSTQRSSNESEAWRSVSGDMPFGIVKWTAKTLQEEKNPTEPRTSFRETVEITEELTAVQIGTEAESELVTD